jgi:replicative DNA helicase
MADGGLFPGLSLRQPPQNLMAEGAILGALLANNRSREQCLDLLPEHFIGPGYGQVFAKAVERIDKGERVDAIALSALFPADLLADLKAAMIGLDIRTYVAAVIDCAARRRLIDIGELLVTQAFAGVGAIGLANDAAGQLDALALSGGEANGVMLDVAVTEAITAMAVAMDRKGPIGLSSGFKCIDERLGGLEDETLNVIAARPGMGKTALACDIALKVARAGIPVLIWSLEMSRVQLARRLLASAAGIPVIAIKRGRIGVEGAERVVAASKPMQGLPLWIADDSGVRASTIAVRSRSWRRVHPGPALVIVDHLHIVRTEDGDIRSGPTYAVGQVSGALKRLSKSCKLPVIALAQLNRGVEGREDKRPGLVDLRASGDIEQDADSVGFLYREEYYLTGDPKQLAGETDVKFAARAGLWQQQKADAAGVAELLWAKVRDGSPGTDKLQFQADTTSFSEVA